MGSSWLQRAPFHYRPLPYADRLDARAPESVTLIVIHCTELPDLATAREYGERVLYPDSQTGNSGHFYVDRDGSQECWVPPHRTAHHVRGHNDSSLGIELVNTGRFPDWLHSGRQLMTEPYPGPQVDSLLRLLAWLTQQYPSITQLAGHEDLDREQVPATNDPNALVFRKRDPGPLFPWPRVIEASGLSRCLPA